MDIVHRWILLQNIHSYIHCIDAKMLFLINVCDFFRGSLEWNLCCLWFTLYLCPEKFRSIETYTYSTKTVPSLHPQSQNGEPGLVGIFWREAEDWWNLSTSRPHLPPLSCTFPSFVRLQSLSRPSFLFLLSNSLNIVYVCNFFPVACCHLFFFSFLPFMLFIFTTSFVFVFLSLSYSLSLSLLACPLLHFFLSTNLSSTHSSNSVLLQSFFCKKISANFQHFNFPK